jgi:hypothetical protein
MTDDNRMVLEQIRAMSRKNGSVDPVYAIALRLVCTNDNDDMPNRGRAVDSVKLAGILIDEIGDVETRVTLRGLFLLLTTQLSLPSDTTIRM